MPASNIGMTMDLHRCHCLESAFPIVLSKCVQQGITDQFFANPIQMLSDIFEEAESISL